MLEKIDNLSSDIANIIIYTNSAILQSVLSKKIKNNYCIAYNLTKYADNTSSLKQVKNETFTPPFGGGTWLLNIQSDNIPLSELAKQLDKVSNSAVTVYWTSNYMLFKRMCELETVKKQGNYCFSLYSGRLYPEDITYIHNILVPKELGLSAELLAYLKKNYTYDVDSVCRLFQAVSQHEVIKTTKDIISLVGIGGNTVDSYVIKLLSTNPKTDKGLSKSFESMLILLNDLHYSYDYNSIRNFMRSSISAIIEIKQLQLMGKYSAIVKNIPSSGFNTEKIQRLKRFERIILEDINIARVLKLKLCLDKFTSFDSELALIEFLSYYLGEICALNKKNPESNELSSNKRRRKF